MRRGAGRITLSIGMLILIMQKTTSLLLFFLWIQSTLLYGQERYTISGYVRDSTSNETIIGATITVEGRSVGITTNQYGFYSITLNAGVYKFSVSHIGYTSYASEIQLNKNSVINFKLLPRIMQSKEIIVRADKREKNIKIGRAHV